MSDKIVVIHQPDFLPYLGFFSRLDKADIYVVFDNVQYVRSSRGWNSRDKIKTKNGEKWITVSTQKAPRETAINKILLSKDERWREDHINLIVQNYKSAPYFHEIMPYLEELYQYQCERMMDFNLKSIYLLMELFDIQVETVTASDLNPVGKNNLLIIDIMKKLNCHKYLSGVGAKDYFVPEPYEQAGIEVIWQDFKHPVYKQQYDGFLPYLSSIDLLFNCGIAESRKIIKKI